MQSEAFGAAHFANRPGGRAGDLEHCSAEFRPPIGLAAQVLQTNWGTSSFGKPYGVRAYTSHLIKVGPFTFYHCYVSLIFVGAIRSSFVENHAYSSPAHSSLRAGVRASRTGSGLFPVLYCDTDRGFSNIPVLTTHMTSQPWAIGPPLR